MVKVRYLGEIFASWLITTSPSQQYLVSDCYTPGGSYSCHILSCVKQTLEAPPMLQHVLV